MRRLLLIPLVLLLASCGSGASPEAAVPTDAPTTAAPPPAPPVASAPEPSTPAPAPAGPATPALEPARCAPDAGANCAAHTGRVLAVESVDADGDGDLHVIGSGGSVTAPGITVFDVSKELRPATDPRPGDRVTGAGPVYPGSLGQRQIQVTTFRVSRARG